MNEYGGAQGSDSDIWRERDIIFLANIYHEFLTRAHTNFNPKHSLFGEMECNERLEEQR
jgi:hypothetical protein